MAKVLIGNVKRFLGETKLRGFVFANASWVADHANPLGLIKTLPNLSTSVTALWANVTAPPLTKLSVTSPTSSKVGFVVESSTPGNGLPLKGDQY